MVDRESLSDLLLWQIMEFMEHETLKIIAVKHMVCPRCILLVEQLAKQSGLKFTNVKLGELSLEEAPDEVPFQEFRKNLEENGFEIVESKRALEINKIKSLIIKRVHFGQGSPEQNLSSFLSSKLNSEYSRLSKLFTAMEGLTIERFATLQRIEKAKELLIYDQLNMTQVAEQLDYSSPAHFSAQFKRETGVSPSSFKQLRNPPRKPIDSIH